MYIQPNSTIKILHNIPIDVTYEHTLDFSNATAQQTYFSSKAKYTLDNYSYQRSKQGFIKVEKKIEDLYDCNYLMFINTSFENRWFYAFITNLNYINNDVTEIEYQLDIMQTWQFDYTLQNVFVEREHAPTDVAGDNIVPENLELGDYMEDREGGTDYNGQSLIANTSIVIATTFDENYDDVSGVYYGGTFSGLHYQSYPNTIQGARDCADWIANVPALKTSGIVSVSIMPTKMIVEKEHVQADYVISKLKRQSTIGSYTPKNKKLFTHPYNFLYVTNMQGNAATYPYEYFSESNCRFVVTGNMSTAQQNLLIPIDYKGASGQNYDEYITLGGFPQCSYNIDSFKLWLAQKIGGVSAAAVGGAMTAAAANGSAVGSAWAASETASAGLAAAGTAINPAVPVAIIAGVLTTVGIHATIPPQAHGNGDSNAMITYGEMDFQFYNKHITEQFARIIDEYFTMYGYATHRVKTPNTKSRRYWNYIKTCNCKITGSIPCDDEKIICNLYNRGITFWHDATKVGDYSLTNSIV